MTDLDLATILAEHQPRRPTFLITEEWWCPECDVYFEGDEGCLPYRLAAEVKRVHDREQAFHNQAETYRQEIDRLARETREAKAEGWDECHRASLGGFEAINPYRDCPHLSFTGVDTYFGPGKIMRCDICGYEKSVDWNVKG